MAEQTGLSFVGYVLSPFVWIGDQCVELWANYIALLDVGRENALLREELRKARAAATLSAEDKAELERLRNLLRIEALHERPGFAARIIAKRFGPNAVLQTLTVNKGYLDGAVVGTPVVTGRGVVGRVLRTAPHAATVLLLTDPGFRLAVISQESRTPGILSGTSAAGASLEVAYVSQTAQIAPGNTLITSGVDGVFPKGLPVGVVTSVMPGNETLFQQVHAQPLADIDYLEEVILLQQDDSGPPLLERLPGPLKSAPSPWPGQHAPVPEAQNGASSSRAPARSD